MLESIRTDWWLIALRGLVAVVFGIVALAWPQQTATALVILIAIFVLVDGVLSLVTSVRDRSASWQFGVFEGIVGVVVGILALAMPRVTAAVLAVILGIWALVTGVLELVAVVRMRDELRSEWLLGIAGALSVLLGLALVIAPFGGVIALTVLVGIYAILFGASLIVYGVRRRA